jgi:hypothetical protein
VPKLPWQGLEIRKIELKLALAKPLPSPQKILSVKTKIKGSSLLQGDKQCDIP